jgi:hypothetical protein
VQRRGSRRLAAAGFRRRAAAGSRRRAAAGSRRHAAGDPVVTTAAGTQEVRGGFIFLRGWARRGAGRRRRGGGRWRWDGGRRHGVTRKNVGQFGDGRWAGSGRGGAGWSGLVQEETKRD